jgi:hypothetical protein
VLKTWSDQLSRLSLLLDSRLSGLSLVSALTTSDELSLGLIIISVETLRGRELHAH